MLITCNSIKIKYTDTDNALTIRRIKGEVTQPEILQEEIIMAMGFERINLSQKNIIKHIFFLFNVHDVLDETILLFFKP